MAMLDSEEFKKYMQHEWEESRNRMRMLTLSMLAMLIFGFILSLVLLFA